MTHFINRLMQFFLGVFAVCVVLVIVYAVFWQEPGQRCEGHGNWWDASDRTCAKPIFIPNLTHRPIGSPPLTAGQGQASPPSSRL